MENINLGVWETFTREIRNHLRNDNVNNFFNWPIIINTMVAGVDDAEIHYLENSKNWNKWQQTINESILKPDSHPKYPQSSRNNLHHAYSLDVMMNETNYSLSDFKTIVEFGGGYGNMCRLIKNWNLNCEYYIYDIPELLEIQKNYLEKNSIGNTHLIKEFDKVENLNTPSLFLGLWSISETPVSERKKMLDNLKALQCDVIFIAMGGMFFSENNLEWLEREITPNLSNYTTKLIRIPHGTDMFYFVAVKK